MVFGEEVTVVIVKRGLVMNRASAAKHFGDFFLLFFILIFYFETVSHCVTLATWNSQCKSG